jgi:hypothetical protein
VNQLRNKAVEQTTLSSPLRMVGRRENQSTAGMNMAREYPRHFLHLAAREKIFSTASTKRLGATTKEPK